MLTRDVAPVVLDDVDRKLIALLIADGRTSNRALAAEVGLTEVTVANRLRRLTNGNVITVTALFDWEAAGYEWLAAVRFVCRGRDPGDVARDLEAISGAMSAAIVFGDVDIVAHFLLHDRADLHRLTTQELPAVRGAEVVGVDLATETYVQRAGMGTFPINPEPAISFPAPVVDLDDLDVGLLRSLTADGRQSNREVARHLGVSEGTVRLRTRRLVESNLVRISAVVDPVVLGTVGAVAFCYVDVDRAVSRSVIDALASLPQCWQLTSVVGAHDLQMLLVCGDRQELVESVMDHVRTTPGVRSTITTEVISVPFHVYNWVRLM